MGFSSFVAQLLNGLAGASSLFMVSAGLSLIFGVTRIVNFAHGSFYMIGVYLAYTIVDNFGASIGFWPSLLLAALAVGVLGAITEIILLRRIYRAPELFQLLATFALVLVLKDAVLWLWGPDELLGPRAPGLGGSVPILGRNFPSYSLFLIVMGPLVLAAMWLLLTRTRWGTLVRAATQDREMVSALGINQAWLFTSVFALGAFLAGVGGALQLPIEPANLEMDLGIIGSVFVVVVVGGMGSIPGAYVAALLIAELKAICIWLGVVDIFGLSISFSKLTLVAEFLLMAVVLVVRPYGLFGRPQPPSRHVSAAEKPLRPAGSIYRTTMIIFVGLLVLTPFVAEEGSYTLVLAIDLMVAALFATSLHFMMGPAGMHSFGHAAYFGLGAYGAGVLMTGFGLPMELALALAPLAGLAGAFVYGWFCVRLSGVYLAMLTLAFAQITWAICYQWDEVTGGSNGMIGLWPASWLADKSNYYLLVLAVAGSCIWLLRHMLFSPFGYGMRACRDSVLRADAIGIDVKRLQWYTFTLAGLFAAVAGALFAFSKGSISPETLAVAKSVDGLVMVMLGGVQTLLGPLVGAVSFGWLQDNVARGIEYWRVVLGGVILLLVLLFPQGISGFVQHIADRWREQKGAAA